MYIYIIWYLSSMQHKQILRLTYMNDSGCLHKYVIFLYIYIAIFGGLYLQHRAKNPQNGALGTTKSCIW